MNDIRRIIDLKNRNAKGELSLGSPTPTTPPSAQQPTPARAQPLSVQWAAFEYEQRARGPYWYVYPGIAALLLVVFGVFSQNYTFIAFTALASILYMILLRTPPVMTTYMVGPDGVHVGSKRYDYAHIKSFWVADKHSPPRLHIEIPSLFTTHMILPLGNANSDEIRTVLGKHLEEREHDETLVDQFAKLMGL